MENQEELSQKNAEIRKRIDEAIRKIDNAIQINYMQKKRLMVMEVEIKSLEKQMMRKPFSILNLFKKN